MTDPTTRETLINHLFRVPARVSAAVLVGAIVIGLVVGGPVGIVLLGAAIIAMTGMVALMWPDIPATERLLRLAVIALVVAAAVVRLVPN